MHAAALRVIVVEDSDDDYRILLRELARGGREAVAERVDTAVELRAAIARGGSQLVVTDWIVPGFGGAAAIAIAREAGLPCIVVSGTVNEEAAVAALRAGALDFVSKDKPAMFAPAIDRALRESEEHRARLAAERALRQSEELYRRAFEVAPEALLALDLDRGATVDANPAALRLFGRSLDELRAAGLGAYSLDHVDELRAYFARLAAGNDIPPFEWKIVHANGEVIPIEVHAVRLPHDGQRMLRLTLLDLRDRQRADELHRHAIELELANRRIQEANRSKSEFLANMSHELRTPLNAIIGFAELLHDHRVAPGAPEHDEFLADILASARHLLQLINDVLDLAKVEAGKLEFRPEHVDLGRIVGEVVAITRPTAAAKHIAVATEIDRTCAEAFLDPNRFKQILYNYVSNALKFTPDGGRVAIRVAPEGDASVRIEVEDTGVGIAAEDLGRLFVEFHQLETGSAKRHQGTGLGLALARRLVEAQGGSVGVRSTPGKGSVFHAVVPRKVTT